MTRVKICGLKRPEDAELAIELGADALGFVYEPTSPRYMGDDDAWIGELPLFPPKVAVFGRVDRGIDPEAYDAVQGVVWDVQSWPARRRIQAIRPRAGQTVDEVLDCRIEAAMVVLDAFRADAFGGTGERIDWNLAAEVVARLPLPVILAGGLNPDNVAEAIARVRPYAVDVSSGIESSPGVKDAGRMRAFFQAVRG